MNHEGHEGHEDKIKKKKVIKVFSYLSLRALRVLRGKIRITECPARDLTFNGLYVKKYTQAPDISSKGGMGFVLAQDR